jgi:hypothetical protein
MPAYEAAFLLAKAPPGRPIPTSVGAEQVALIVVETPNGRVWAAPGTSAIKEPIPNDVMCSGTNSSRVMSDAVLRLRAKGAIGNDAGIAMNNTAVEGVAILGERGIPAAAVASLSARLSEGLSTWNDGIISVVNPVARARGVAIGMAAREAARLML